MARAAPLPHATVSIGRHGVEVHLIKVFCVGQLAVIDDLCEAVTMLEEIELTTRRVLGGAHPTAEGIEDELRHARVILSAREGDVEPLRAAVEAMARTT